MALGVVVLGVLAVSIWFIADKRIHNKAAGNDINWVSHGPGSFGYMTSVVSDPNDAQVAYGASDVSGIFKTADGGETWKFANNGMSGYYVGGIQIDPANNNTIYAYTKRGVYVSTNAAGEWTKMENSPPILEIPSEGIEKLSASLSGTSFLALGNKKKDQPDQTVLYTLVLDGIQKITGVTDVDGVKVVGGVYRNVNGSADWVKLTDVPKYNGNEDLQFYSLAVDPQDYDHIFVGTKNALYETTNAGAGQGNVTWQSWYYNGVDDATGNPWNSSPNEYKSYRTKATLLPNYDIRFVGFNKKNSDIVYAVNRHGELFRSDRNSPTGTNFSMITPISGNLPPEYQIFECTTAVQYNPEDCGGRMSVQGAYVDTNEDATEDTVYLSMHDGSYFPERGTVLTYNTNTGWKAIAHYENATNVVKNIYAPSEWSVSDWTTGNTMGVKTHLDVNQNTPYNNRKVYVSWGGGLGKGQKTVATDENSWRWDVTPFGVENYMPQDAQYDPNDPNIIYILSLDQGFVKSTDGGATFKRKSDGMYYTSVPDSRLCPGGKGPDCFRGHAMRLVVLPDADKTKPSKLLMLGYPWGDKFRLYQSTDGGENWSYLPALTETMADNTLYDPRFFYNQEDKLLFMTKYQSNVVLYSKDFGESWASITTDGLTGTNIPVGQKPIVGGLEYDAQNHSLTAGIYNGNGGIYQITYNPNTDNWQAPWNYLEKNITIPADATHNESNNDMQVVSIAQFNNEEGTMVGTVRNWGALGPAAQPWVEGNENPSGSTCGIIKSTDRGLKWTLIANQNNLDCEVSIKKSDPTVFYTTSTAYNVANSVMKITDTGNGVTSESEGSALPYKKAKKVVIHPNDSSKVLLLSYAGGLFWSYNPNELQAPATINYTLTLQGAVNNTTSGVSLKIYNVGGKTPVFEKADLTTDGAGKNIFFLSDFDPGNYDVEIKVPGYLAKILRGQQVSDGVNLQFLDLQGGDLNNDNGINAGDYTYFSGKWLTNDPVTDINRDGSVNGGDFNIMNNNWWHQGDNIGV